MNSTRTTMGCIIALSMVVAGFANARPAFARHDASRPTKTAQVVADDTKAGGGAATQAPAAAPKARSSKTLARAPKPGVRMQARIVQINKLREMMDEKVELTSTQKRKVDGLFNYFIKTAKNAVPQRQLQTPPEAGDTAAVERVGGEIRPLKKEPLPPTDDPSEVLIEKVRAQLNPDQVPAFEKVVERWKVITSLGPRTGPLLQLRRALQDPEVGLSESEKADADKVLRDTLKSLQSDPDCNPEKMETAADKARSTICEKLTPLQRSKIEANLKMFKAEQKELNDSTNQGPNRVDKPKTEDAKGAAKPDSPDKKDAAKPDNDNGNKDNE
ncbi:MAG: hypothetical protein V1790_01295 [Planctomycetota bacterium]